MEPRATSEIELAADATLSNNNRQGNANSSFYNIQGGYPKPHLTPHLNNGQVPLGGNILFLDGRVTWRKFNAMAIRTIGGPYFWF
jgi:prepilin-type processing-associated H-X9-DG protein